jgi:hypothetical protein
VETSPSLGRGHHAGNQRVQIAKIANAMQAMHHWALAAQRARIDPIFPSQVWPT